MVINCLDGRFAQGSTRMRRSQAVRVAMSDLCDTVFRPFLHGRETNSGVPRWDASSRLRRPVTGLHRAREDRGCREWLARVW